MPDSELADLPAQPWSQNSKHVLTLRSTTDMTYASSEETAKEAYELRHFPGLLLNPNPQLCHCPFRLFSSCQNTNNLIELETSHAHTIAFPFQPHVFTPSITHSPCTDIFWHGFYFLREEVSPLHLYVPPPGTVHFLPTLLTLQGSKSGTFPIL